MYKIVEIDKLPLLIEEIRSQGRTIITTNGSFDLLHVGHVRLLKKAKEAADVLIVGINSDSSVRGYKGADRPIVSESERAEMVAALECTDYVFIFDDENPCNFLELLKPNFHANSAEYGEDCVEKKVLDSYGGKLVLIPRQSETSTSAIIGSLHSTETI